MAAEKRGEKVGNRRAPIRKKNFSLGISE